MTCAELRETLSAYADGQLAALPPDVAAHVEHCAECQRAERAYRHVSVELTEFYSSGFTPVSMKPLLARERQRSAWLRIAMGAAATVALVVAAIHFYPAHQQYPLGALAVPAHAPAEFTVDGATLWADAGTRISVTAPRKLNLQSGSAFFHVTKGQGEFSVATPNGTERVLGTEFVVTVDGSGTAAVVQSGVVSVDADFGSVTLTAAQGASVAPHGKPTEPAAASAAAAMLWRPWTSLTQLERSERLSVLRERLAGDDYDVVLRARTVALLADPGTFGTMLAWYAAGSPRLKLQLVFIAGQRPVGDEQARQLLATVAAKSGEAPDLRLQAIRGLAEVGTKQELEVLQGIAGSRGQEELSSAATLAIRKINAR